VAGLAVVEAERLDLADRGPGQDVGVGLGRQAQQMSLEEVRHGEARRRLDRLGEQGHRVAVIEVEGLDGLDVERRRLGGRAVQGISLQVLDHDRLLGLRAA